MKLWLKILIALVLGAVVGFILGPQAEYLKPIGALFMRMVNMVVVLLIFSSMTIGMSNIQDPKKLGRLGVKSLLMYLSTTIIAIMLGIFFAKLFDLGGGLELARVGQPVTTVTPPSLKDMFLNIIPANPVAALAEGNVLQIITFAIFLGAAINFSGKRENLF